MRISLKLVLLATLVLLTACGYRPSAQFAKKVIGEKVYTNVDVSLSDPENAVLTKDALNRALQTRLKTIVTRKEDAEAMIAVVYENIRFVPLQYDKNGYVVFYQVNMTLRFTFEKGKHQESRKIIGRYEFPILPTAIIANDLRIKAIEKSSSKALDQFIAYIAAKGYFVNEQ
jgi:outer membrane lipopolysaccharide assembly protein LptE/RlpB